MDSTDILFVICLLLFFVISYLIISIFFLLIGPRLSITYRNNKIRGGINNIKTIANKGGSVTQGKYNNNNNY